MKPIAIVLMGLLSLLFGCRSSSKGSKGPFEKQNGVWYFNDRAIESADVESFQALDEHYAKDKAHVYYADTYRDGKDYFTTKRSRVMVVVDADPGMVRLLGQGYARDGVNAFFEGERFPVDDIATFELLEYGYARDRVHGYYLRSQIAGSDGASFAALNSYYSKDKAHVFFSDLVPSSDGSPSKMKHSQLPGARPASFTVEDDGYGSDAGRGYYRDKSLTDAGASFQVLSYGYAKSATQVFYRGDPVRGADAATFVALVPPTDSADATDVRGSYQQGRRAKGAR